MELVTKELAKKLARNRGDGKGAKRPVLKIFCPAGAATWLIHSSERQDPDILFGLCDLGMGFPELGSVRLSELEDLRVPVRITGSINTTIEVKLERDLHFHPVHSLRAYARAASMKGHITELNSDLDQAARRFGEEPMEPEPDPEPDPEEQPALPAIPAMRAKRRKSPDNPPEQPKDRKGERKPEPEPAAAPVQAALNLFL